ncbi:hypothetical protein DRN74_07185, partial [Candidatus Micrarchaeota archaeon]
MGEATRLLLAGAGVLLLAVILAPASCQSLVLQLTSPSGGTVYRTDPVTIAGTLTYGGTGIGGQMVTLTILNPHGSLFLQRLVSTDPSGQFSLTITVPSNAQTGNYSVSAFYLSARDDSWFLVADTSLNITPTSWTIGDYGYIETGDPVPDKVFYLHNSGASGRTATITYPSFLSFGSNASTGFNVDIPAGQTVRLIVDDVNTSTPGDFAGDIVVNSSGEALYVRVTMRVRDTLSPQISVQPSSWSTTTTKRSNASQSFQIRNSGTALATIDVQGFT